MRKELTKNLIRVVCNGNFVDINEKVIPYRVVVELPDCIEEWLKSNIKNRYIKEAIKNGKELLVNGKERENKLYYDVRNILSLNVEESNDKGDDAIVITDKIPTFYGKSILDFSYGELQDFAVAFGLHEIPIEGSIEKIRKSAFIAYLKRVEKMSDKEIKELSFYKYDKARHKYYIEFNEDDRAIKIVNHINIDVAEFKEEDEKIKEGTRSISDVFKTQIKTKNNHENRIIQDSANNKDTCNNEDNNGNNFDNNDDNDEGIGEI